jgi:ADP-ribosylglycohydrolase
LSSGFNRVSEAVTSVTEKNRVHASLEGLATGDAIGKQTENLSREGVAHWYPRGVRGFEGPPGTIIPRYATNRKHQWLFGETTDDTERTLAVARAVLRDGDVRHVSVGRELLRCKKSVHPGVQSLWEFHEAADPTRVALDHNGCGAAIRVAPVGILYRSGRLEEIVEGAHQASISTHGGALALAAAAATAAAVSAAIDGADGIEILRFAQVAGERAEQRSGSPGTVFAESLGSIYDELSRLPRLDADDVARRYTPTQPLTIVALAIALAALMDSAESAILLAANIGGDSDSVASIAGAILGARHPDSVNQDWYGVVEAINQHRLASFADDLSALRA